MKNIKRFAQVACRPRDALTGRSRGIRAEISQGSRSRRSFHCTSEDEDDIPSYCRILRITPVGADEAIELFLEAGSPDALQIREVSKLGPAEKPKPDDSDWLIPKVYKGKSEYDPEAEDPS